jgi:hypothetical protein
MNDFVKRLSAFCSAGDFDGDTGEAAGREVRKVYDRLRRRARLQFWWRFGVAAAITVYGALGIKYNTGRYVEWALFVALVGANAGFAILLWYWQVDTKLGITREMKELRVELEGLKREPEAKDK